MGSRILKNVTALSLCALVAGALSAPSMARNFPAKPRGGVPAGIPEQGKYTMTRDGQRVGSPGTRTPGGITVNSAGLGGQTVEGPGTGTAFGIAGSLAGPALLGEAAGAATTSGFRQNGFGAGSEIQQLIPEGATVLPSTFQKDQRLLAVHRGTETVYVSFKSDAERKEYIGNLQRKLAGVGMEIQSRAGARAGKAEGNR